MEMLYGRGNQILGLTKSKGKKVRKMNIEFKQIDRQIIMNA